MNSREIERAIPAYEGLIFRTTTMILAARPELERDDVQQRLRIKVWKGLAGYRRAKATQELKGFVFSCVMNEKKDILKAKRRRDAYIEDEAPVRDEDGGPRDAFELRYLSIAEEVAFATVETRDLRLPCELTDHERQVMGLLYEGFMQVEIRELMQLSMRALYELLASIRAKMADWRPSAGEHRVDPPLPRPLRAQPDVPAAAAPPRSQTARGVVPSGLPCRPESQRSTILSAG